MYYLNDPSRMPKIEGIQVPYDFYWVLDTPGPLAGMRKPSDHTPWSNISKAGFAYVINLRSQCREYDPSPLKVAYSEALQDLCSGHPPSDPALEERLVKKAVAVIVPLITDGQGVVLHCMGGRGRTGTVLGCVLRKLGYAAEDVIGNLDSLHKSRGKVDGWPESNWQANLVRRFHLL